LIEATQTPVELGDDAANPCPKLTAVIIQLAFQFLQLLI